MVANWVKVVGILIGGTVAAAGAAYVGGMFEPSPGSARVEAAVQQPPAGQSGQGKEAPAADGAVVAGDEPKVEENQQVASLPQSDEPAAAVGAPAAAPAVIVPVFDLVRVEPDGSVVIAGNAAPRSMVEVITGAAVIGTSRAGEVGDFAVVLDNPLKPGDYTVVLRSTTEDNVVATSAQTAIIAVPETEDGQVLALVEEPGAPSRLITVPSVPDAAPAEADAKGDRPSATEQAGTDTAEAEKQQVPELDTAAAVAVDEPKPDVAAADEPKQEMQAEAAGPEAQPEPEEVASSEDGGAPAVEEQVVAAATPEPKPAQPAAPARVAVEAVEIEGRDVFVAGRADVGSTVRVYANDILLGQTSTAESGRFLVEAEKDLPVGDYIVRADMLSADNSEVIARAIVPFEREPGEKLAAVAAPQPAQPVESAVQQPKTQADAGAAGEETVAADAAAPSEQEKPGGEMAAAAEPKTEGPAETAAASAESNADEPRPAETVAADETAADEPVEMAAMDGKVEEGSADEGAIANEATAPKLQNVDGAVIIRRGDTLWQLSRRVYGRGVRYTTIYLANQDQIADPDRIWPGQVFSVPGETGEGETADMSAVAEQVAGPGEKAEEVVTR